MPIPSGDVGLADALHWSAPPTAAVQRPAGNGDHGAEGPHSGEVAGGRAVLAGPPPGDGPRRDADRGRYHAAGGTDRVQDALRRWARQPAGPGPRSGKPAPPHGAALDLRSSAARAAASSGWTARAGLAGGGITWYADMRSSLSLQSGTGPMPVASPPRECCEHSRPWNSVQAPRARSSRTSSANAALEAIEGAEHLGGQAARGGLVQVGGEVQGELRGLYGEPDAGVAAAARAAVPDPNAGGDDLLVLVAIELARNRVAVGERPSSRKGASAGSR